MVLRLPCDDWFCCYHYFDLIPFWNFFMFFVVCRRDCSNSWHFVAFFVALIKLQVRKKVFCTVVADGINVEIINSKSMLIQINQSCSQQRE